MSLRTRDELAPFFAAAANESREAFGRDEAAPANPYLPLADFLQDCADPRSVLVKAHWAAQAQLPGMTDSDWLRTTHTVTLPDGSTVRLDLYRGGVIAHWDGFQSWAGQANPVDEPLPFSAVLSALDAAALAEGLPVGETVVQIYHPESDSNRTVPARSETAGELIHRLYSL